MSELKAFFPEYNKTGSSQKSVHPFKTLS